MSRHRRLWILIAVLIVLSAIYAFLQANRPPRSSAPLGSEQPVMGGPDPDFPPPGFKRASPPPGEDVDRDD